MSYPRFYSFWAINGPLDRERLFYQLEQFKSCGLDGVVWHPRFYPNAPPYLSDEYLNIVSDVILRARDSGLMFWIYDEDGWPSGTVGGQLLKKHPEDAQHWAGLTRERPARGLAEFRRDGVAWYLSDNLGPGVDYLSPSLGRHFIEMTYERYHTGLAPAAFAHVEAFFSDEPEFGLGHAYDALPKDGALPWTPRLPELFRERHGEALEPLIPLLFFPGERAAEVRVKFWELLTDLFNEAFIAPINAWCAEHGKRFTAHVKGEEHPLFQVPTSGSCHQVFRHLSLPAIDALERSPANDFYPRQVSSAARQFGDGRCMVEAFGGSGWGGRPEDLERYLLWLGRHGLTDFVMHLSQYRLDSAAMHDWPPSQPLHLTWSHLYADVIGRVRAELAAHPRVEADTLLVAPYREIMSAYTTAEFMQTNVHNAATYPDTEAGRINRRFMSSIRALHAAGVAYDVVDERTLDEVGEHLPDGGMRVGKCVYRRLMAVEEVDVLLKGAAGAVEPIECNLGTEVLAPVTWSLIEHPVNTLLLDCEPVGDGVFRAEFFHAPLPEDTGLALRFADAIAEVWVDGVPLAITATDEGAVAAVTGVGLQPRNRVSFRTVGEVARPFVWVEGRMRVVSATGFGAGPGETIRTQGPFQIEPAAHGLPADLVAGGFPFLRVPLHIETTLELTAPVTRLGFDGVVADAVRLTVDGHDYGWAWGEARFDLELARGSHTVRLELVPNGYNSYGPHHYYGGDWHVISPDQIKGTKNFADPVDAPGHTHVPGWHFRRFELPRTVGLWLA